MNNYNEVFFDFLNTVIDNIQYCMLNCNFKHAISYTYVNNCALSIELFYYDGYYGLDFNNDKYRFFITDEYFYFVDIEAEEKDVSSEPVIPCINDYNLDITDKESYFQCSMIENLQNVPFYCFPLIKRIRKAYFTDVSTRTVIKGGFRFIK